MRRTRGLSTRLVVAIGLLAALQLTVFVVLLMTLHDIGRADHAARGAAGVAMSSNDSRIALARGDALGMRDAAAALARSGARGGAPETAALARALRAQADAPQPFDPPTSGARALDSRLAALATRQRASRTVERERVTRLTRLAWIAGGCGVAATLLCA